MTDKRYNKDIEYLKEYLKEAMTSISNKKETVKLM